MHRNFVFVQSLEKPDAVNRAGRSADANDDRRPRLHDRNVAVLLADRNRAPRLGRLLCSDLERSAATLGRGAGGVGGIVRSITCRGLAARRNHEAVRLSGLDVEAITAVAGWQTMASNADRRGPGGDLEHGRSRGQCPIIRPAGGKRRNLFAVYLNAGCRRPEGDVIRPADGDGSLPWRGGNAWR